jgi:protein-S-isoprenylcysteine O-methyltransferase Ste14
MYFRENDYSWWHKDYFLCLRVELILPTKSACAFIISRSTTTILWHRISVSLWWLMALIKVFHGFTLVILLNTFRRNLNIWWRIQATAVFITGFYSVSRHFYFIAIHSNAFSNDSLRQCRIYNILLLALCSKSQVKVKVILQPTIIDQSMLVSGTLLATNFSPSLIEYF